MTGGPQPIRTYLRNPWWVFLAVGILTAGQGFAIVVSRSERWIGHWSNSSAVVGWAVLFGASVAAAAAAWVVASPRRSRCQDLLAGSSRTRARVYGQGLVAVAAGNIAGYAIVAGYVAARTAPLATHGRMSLMELLPTLAAVPAAVAVGAAVGRVLPPVLAPVGAALIPYVAYAGSIYADAYAGRMLFSDLFAMDDTTRDYLAVPTELLLLKGGFWLAFGVALLSWILAARRIAYAAGIATSLTLAGALLIAGVRTDVPDAYRAVCTGSPPVVCVDRAHDHLLIEYRERINAELAKLPGMDLSGAIFVQSPALLDDAGRLASAAPTADPGVVVVVPVAKDNTEPAHDIDGRMLTARFGHSLFGQPCVASGRSDGIVLYEWWLAANQLPTDGSNFPGDAPVGFIVADDPQLAAASNRFAALSPSERERWFALHGPDVLACTAVRDSGIDQG